MRMPGQIVRQENIKVWYDGYRFGNFEVYCPWDVMNYLRDFQQNPEARPVSYWKNTSDNAIIRSFIVTREEPLLKNWKHCFPAVIFFSILMKI